MTEISINRLTGIIGSMLPLLLAAGPNEKPAAPATTRDAAVHRGPVFEDVERFKRIVIAADANAMPNKAPILKDQLSKTYHGLLPDQLFNLIFFMPGQYDAMSEKLLPASADNKRKADKFLEGISGWPTDPIAGIEAAFKLNPEVIYLLTDGDFPDNDAVLKKIRELNKDKKVKVYTIAFVSSTDTDTAFIDLLKTIANETGGHYKHAIEDDL